MLQHPVMFQKSSLVLPTSQLQFVFCVPLLFSMRAALSGNCFHVCSGRNLNSTASITNLWSEVRCCCEPDLITSTSVGPQFNCFYPQIINIWRCWWTNWLKISDWLFSHCLQVSNRKQGTEQKAARRWQCCVVYSIIYFTLHFLF